MANRKLYNQQRFHLKDTKEVARCRPGKIISKKTTKS